MNKGMLTRQRIVELAAPIFNQHGYAGSSMHDVMQATGLEKGGLYRHFGSKEELAAESFRYALNQTLTVRSEGLNAISSAVEKLRHIVRQFVEVPSPTPGGCPLMNTAIDADDGNPVLRKLAAEAISDWKSRLTLIIEEGMRRKEIRKSVDSRRIANTIIATLEGALMISRVEGNRIALRDVQESLESLFEEIASKQRG
jgi:TetR/AcrR family transcriptional repressor of nem operon